MTTIPDDETTSDRETEAAIRKRIAEEVGGERDRLRRKGIENLPFTDYELGVLRGIGDALQIIERGTGVAGEGKQG